MPAAMRAFFWGCVDNFDWPIRLEPGEADVFAYGLQFIDLDPHHFMLVQNLTYEALLADRQKIVQALSEETGVPQARPIGACVQGFLCRRQRVALVAGNGIGPDSDHQAGGSRRN
jgi:hypothetical protein